MVAPPFSAKQGMFKFSCFEAFLNTGFLRASYSVCNDARGSVPAAAACLSWAAFPIDRR